MINHEPDYPGRRNPWDKKKHPKNYEYIQSLIEQVDSITTRPPKYSDDVKLKVYTLREKGFTLRQIADTVGVSKSTACLYLQKRKAQTFKVTQPGTDKSVETEVSVQEVNVGKVNSKSKPLSNSK